MTPYEALRSFLQTPDSRAWRHMGDGWMISAAFDIHDYATVSIDISTENIIVDEADAWLAANLGDTVLVGGGDTWVFKWRDFLDGLGYDPGLEGSDYDYSIKMRVYQYEIIELDWVDTEPDGAAISSALGTLFPGMEECDVALSCPALPCPITGSCEYVGADEAEATSVSDWVMHLNDAHQWSRERIADWLETLDVDLRAVAGG